MAPKPVELHFIGDNLEIPARKCGSCKEIKPLTEYHVNRKDKLGYHYVCKVCNSQKALAYQRENKDKRRNNILNTRYGISSEQYAEMYIKQEGKCLICNKTDERLVVDHCHKTNIVRGLLCDACNRGLGSFGDDIQLMQNATAYLFKFIKANVE